MKWTGIVAAFRAAVHTNSAQIAAFDQYAEERAHERVALLKMQETMLRAADARRICIHSAIEAADNAYADAVREYERLSKRTEGALLALMLTLAGKAE